MRHFLAPLSILTLLASSAPAFATADRLDDYVLQDSSCLSTKQKIDAATELSAQGLSDKEVLSTLVQADQKCLQNRAHRIVR